MSQAIISGIGSSSKVAEILEHLGSRKFLLVKDSSYPFLSNREVLESIPTVRIEFSDFTPNPLYEQVMAGVDAFNGNGCDAIVAVGGGSTIDVAKCIKLYCKMDRSVNCLQQECKDTKVPLIAIPTTAGTGSESTRFAVIYFEGKKQSVNHLSIIPDYAVLDPSVLISLPLYQKKCTMLDALCQGIESWWSVNSTDESKSYSKKAIDLVMGNWKVYINENTKEAAEQIMLAANFAGRAINITQTTAAHAMSYKLTSMYKLPHGHAVAVCLPHVWEYMVGHLDECIDPRGQDYLSGVFSAISKEMGCSTADEAIAFFRGMMKALDMKDPTLQNDSDIEILTASVNPVRLKNNPVKLSEHTLRTMYEAIVRR